MLTLQGCTSSYMFPPLSVCTRHVLGRLQVKADVGVDHDLPKHLSLQSRLIAYPGSIRRESGRGFPYGPERCVQGSVTPNGCPVFPATYLPHHSPPLRSALSTASRRLQTPETTCNSWTEN